MLKRSLFAILLLLLPAGAALALPSAPIQTQSYQVHSALFDKMSPTPPKTDLRAQGLLGYIADFHDDQYQYSLPICKDSALVEIDDRVIAPAGFVAGDLLAVSVRPDPATATKSCIERIVRQPVNRGASGGECLQNYQVKHTVVGKPSPMVTGYEYTYQLTIYARPTVDCDAETYGASPITSLVAAHKPFAITLTRDTPGGGSVKIAGWSITTSDAGRASFTHTFATASDAYRFHVTAGSGTTAAGDTIDWSTKIIDPNPPITAGPITTATNVNLSGLPAVYALLIVLIGAIFAEYRHWLLRKRSHELPEQEYYRSSKF